MNCYSFLSVISTIHSNRLVLDRCSVPFAHADVLPIFVASVVACFCSCSKPPPNAGSLHTSYNWCIAHEPSVVNSESCFTAGLPGSPGLGRMTGRQSTFQWHGDLVLRIRNCCSRTPTTPRFRASKCCGLRRATLD